MACNMSWEPIRASRLPGRTVNKIDILRSSFAERTFVKRA
jgi:hypothetical protein